jgi:DNA ligase 1
MTFSSLSMQLSKLEQTSSRIEITQILAGIFTGASKKEIDKIVYLLLGRLAPNYKSIVFNFADQMMIASIAQAFDKSVEEVKARYKELGDLGDVARSYAPESMSTISVEEVYQQMVEAAQDSGEDSVQRKITIMAELLKKLDHESTKYVVRIPLGRLRLGFSDITVLDALSWMEFGDKTGKATLERAYRVLPDIGLLAKEVKAKGVQETAKTIVPVLGIPVMPMLAQRIKSADEMVEKMGEVTVEPKFDGLRVLIHFKRGKIVSAFTRNLNDIGEMFPELEKLGSYLKADSAILDAEAIGFNEDQKSLLDFQTTMQRRRKHEIAESASKIPLNFYVFDLIFLNGKSLMDEEYLRRREMLAKHLSETGPFKITPYTVTSNPDKIRTLYTQYLSEGLEGIMVKKADSAYIPGRTGYRWVKMKQTEEASGKLSDTIDGVILGFTGGQGKRTQFGLGQFLVGVLDKDVIKTITKVGTGLSDDQFRELKMRLTPLVVSEKPKEYEAHKDLTPDYWVAPSVVVELAGDDLTISPKHTAGFALRFPRLVKFRDDKSAKEATTVKEVKRLYDLQKK